MESVKVGLKKFLLVFLISGIIFISGCASQSGQQDSQKTPEPAKTPASRTGGGSDQGNVPAPPALPE